MTAKTGAQRQSSLTARRKAAGLVRVEVWVHPEQAEKLRWYAGACCMTNPREAALRNAAGWKALREKNEEEEYSRGKTGA